MKLFQQLLVAPAALGLLAPVAANAAEININDVASYSSTSEQINEAQFSDVIPGDWAYTALSNLSESYGCVDNSYTQSLKSGQPLTRYEAAALVNACLEGGLMAGGEGLTSDAMRLSNEFGAEMAILKGRVDGLESQIKELSAGSFSSTTKMKGKVAFVVGAVDYAANANNDKGDALSLNYSFRVDLNSSFTGKDRLYTRVMTGNMGAGTGFDSAWGDKAYGTYLSTANSNDEFLKIDKLWYEWTSGDYKFWVGPKIENYYMLASAPSIYKPVFKQFALGGNTSAYASSTDAGFGVAWTQPTESRSKARWTLSSNYVSKGGENSAGGILTDEKTKWLNQVTYGNSRWQVAGAVAFHGCPDSTATTRNGGPCNAWSSYYSTNAGNDTGITGETAYSLRAYWRPLDRGSIPSIQLGYDVRSMEGVATGAADATDAWMAGLTWPKLWNSNRVGLAFGQREAASSYNGTGSDAADDNLVWEAYYEYKLNDHTTITPTLFGGTSVYDGSDDDIFGGLVQTVFKF